jgi:ABC-type multidrug transport system fused ATPase/permease subunit
MSRLRDKVAAHRRQGEERRGTYVPAVDGAPLRVYQWWHAKTGSTIERDNFCHYWRVVIFWAPLLGIRLMVARLLEFKVAQVAVLLLGFGATYMLCRELGIGKAVLTIAGLLYLIVGIFFGIIYQSDGRSYVGLLGRSPVSVQRIGYAVSPVALCVRRVATLFKSAPMSRLGDKLISVSLVMIALVLTAVIVGVLYAMYVEAWWYPLVFIAGLVGFFMLIFGGEKARKAWRDARTERRGTTGNNDAARPRRIRAFMRAVLEFAQLAFEALRVEKWKICPLVEISPTDRVTS